MVFFIFGVICFEKYSQVGCMPEVVCLQYVCCCRPLPLWFNLTHCFSAVRPRRETEFCSAGQKHISCGTCFPLQCDRVYQTGSFVKLLRKSEGVSGRKTSKGKSTIRNTTGKWVVGGQSWRRTHLWLLPDLRKMLLKTRSRKISTKELKYQFRKKWSTLW